MASGTVCSLFVLGRRWPAGERLPVVLAPCAGSWLFCFGLLSYLSVEEILVMESAERERERTQNKQKEKVRGALERLFWW